MAAARRGLFERMEKLPELGRCFNRFYRATMPIMGAPCQARAIDSFPLMRDHCMRIHS
jgi:hypothetical protein